MPILSPDLRDLAPTATILPRSDQFSSVYVNLSGLDPTHELYDALLLLQGGDAPGAWTIARPLTVGKHGADALIGGAIALQAGATDEGTEALERLLNGPAVHAPGDGAVVLAFSDEGMLKFDVNSLGGIALLVFTYAGAGRMADAIALAADAHRVTGAEAFLVLQLLLLRDEKRWQELVDAAEVGDPEDRGRFETAMLRGAALEELGKTAEALGIYLEIGSYDAELTWIAEARRRAIRLDDSPGLPESRPLPPTALWAGWLQSDDALLGTISLRSPRDDASVSSPDGVIAHAHADSVEEALELLDDDVVNGWAKPLAALLAAEGERPDACERLVEVLADPSLDRYLGAFSRWTSAMVFVDLGGVRVGLSEGIDVFALALAARMHREGNASQAKQWVDWAYRCSRSELMPVASSCLSFAHGDFDVVLEETAGLSGVSLGDVMLMALRARALHATGRGEAALNVYDDAQRRAANLGEDAADSELAIRFLRAQLLLELGQHDRARRDIHAIEAVDHTYLGLEELQARLTDGQGHVRGRPDRELRRAVFELYEGRCAECGSNFDIQYDHIIPVALGGSTTLENLQILCGRCNQQKGARL